jgi:hypothetical protein
VAADWLLANNTNGTSFPSHSQTSMPTKVCKSSMSLEKHI